MSVLAATVTVTGWQHVTTRSAATDAYVAMERRERDFSAKVCHTCNTFHATTATTTFVFTYRMRVI